MWWFVVLTVANIYAVPLLMLAYTAVKREQRISYENAQVGKTMQDFANTWLSLVTLYTRKILKKTDVPFCNNNATNSEPKQFEIDDDLSSDNLTVHLKEKAMKHYYECIGRKYIADKMELKLPVLTDVELNQNVVNFLRDSSTSEYKNRKDLESSNIEGIDKEEINGKKMYK